MTKKIPFSGIIQGYFHPGIIVAYLQWRYATKIFGMAKISFSYPFQSKTKVKLKY